MDDCRRRFRRGSLDVNVWGEMVSIMAHSTGVGWGEIQKGEWLLDDELSIGSGYGTRCWLSSLTGRRHAAERRLYAGVEWSYSMLEGNKPGYWTASVLLATTVERQ